MDYNGYKDLLRAARKHVESAKDAALLHAIDTALAPKTKKGLSREQITARNAALRAERTQVIIPALLAGQTYEAISKRLGVSKDLVRQHWCKSMGRSRQTLTEWRAEHRAASAGQEQ